MATNAHISKSTEPEQSEKNCFPVVSYRLIQFSLAGLAGFIKFWDRETWEPWNHHPTDDPTPPSAASK